VLQKFLILIHFPEQALFLFYYFFVHILSFFFPLRINGFILYNAIKHTDQKSDVWFVGCVLYELMCPYRPCDGTSMKDLASHVKRGKCAPVPSFYSSDLRRVVEACLAIEPTKRPTFVQTLRLPYVVGHC
jgi:serine/threonine protein kinase